MNGLSISTRFVLVQRKRCHERAASHDPSTQKRSQWEWVRASMNKSDRGQRALYDSRPKHDSNDFRGGNEPILECCPSELSRPVSLRQSDRIRARAHVPRGTERVRAGGARGEYQNTRLHRSDLAGVLEGSSPTRFVDQVVGPALSDALLKILTRCAE
eukprot:128907_1